MSRGASAGGGGSAGLRPPVPVPMAQRLSALVPALQTLELLLDEVSFDDYMAGLHSRDPVTLKDQVYPLERALEVANNYVIELTALALEELGIASIDGPRDLAALAEAGAITARLAEQLGNIHRARNELTHGYPDVRSSIIYPACQEMVKLSQPFARFYMRWLGGQGYAVPKV